MADSHTNLGPWSVILQPDEGIDRRHASRVVPLEVLNLSISRSGTLSMREAFAILGYPNPYHFASVVSNSSDANMWMEAFQSKYYGGPPLQWRAFFDSLLGHCGAVGDAPIPCFWQELVASYPEAKVVLVQRPVERWLPSCRTLLEGTLDPVSNVIRFLDPLWMGRILGLGRAWTAALFGSTGVDTCLAGAADVYENHYAAIRAAVPPEKRLDYELGSGWEPLCQFLGKPVPDVPFPHANEKDTLQLGLAAFQLRAMKRAGANIAIVSVLVGILAYSGRFLLQRRS